MLPVCAKAEKNQMVPWGRKPNRHIKTNTEEKKRDTTRKRTHKNWSVGRRRVIAFLLDLYVYKEWVIDPTSYTSYDTRPSLPSTLTSEVAMACKSLLFLEENVHFLRNPIRASFFAPVGTELSLNKLERWSKNKPLVGRASLCSLTALHNCRA